MKYQYEILYTDSAQLELRSLQSCQLLMLQFSGEFFHTESPQALLESSSAKVSGSKARCQNPSAKTLHSSNNGRGNAAVALATTGKEHKLSISCWSSFVIYQSVTQLNQSIFLSLSSAFKLKPDQSSAAANSHQDWWLLSVLSSVTSLRADIHIETYSFQMKFVHSLVERILINSFSMQLNNTFQAYTHL